MKSAAAFASMMILAPILDWIWIGHVAAPFYRRELGPMLRHSSAQAPSQGLSFYVAALFVYALISGGILLFVRPRVERAYSQDGHATNRNVPHRREARALVLGGIFGLVVYGVYDLTNFCLLARWTFPAAFLDVSWGVALCALLSWVSVVSARFI